LATYSLGPYWYFVFHVTFFYLIDFCRTPADGEETKKKKDKDEKEKRKKARPQKIESGSDDEDVEGGGWEQVKGGINVAVVCLFIVIILLTKT